jgi:hypothetical protein
MRPSTWTHYAAKQARRAARQVARHQRISGARVELAEEDMEAMRGAPDDSVHEKGLANMIDRARDAFKDIRPTIQWKEGDTMFSIGEMWQRAEVSVMSVMSVCLNALRIQPGRGCMVHATSLGSCPLNLVQGMGHEATSL